MMFIVANIGPTLYRNPAKRWAWVSSGWSQGVLQDARTFLSDAILRFFQTCFSFLSITFSGPCLLFVRFSGLCSCRLCLFFSFLFFRYEELFLANPTGHGLFFISNSRWHICVYFKARRGLRVLCDQHSSANRIRIPAIVTKCGVVVQLPPSIGSNVWRWYPCRGTGGLASD